jgi:hypothetical protein
MDCARVEDLSVVARQIGRAPRGVVGVAHRCRFGRPQVVLVHPVVDGDPFPTLFWLTCPHLRRAVSALESDGWVSRLEDAVRGDGRLRAELEQAHRAYIDLRSARLSLEDWATLAERGMLRSLLEKGIGGSADLGRIKCLHVHVAHALAGGGNPIGRIVLAGLEAAECDPENTICSAP